MKLITIHLKKYSKNTGKYVKKEVQTTITFTNTRQMPVCQPVILTRLLSRFISDYGYYERGFLVEPYSGYVYVCILAYVE